MGVWLVAQQQKHLQGLGAQCSLDPVSPALHPGHCPFTLHCPSRLSHQEAARRITHNSTQWAAVSTHWGWTREPPHSCCHRPCSLLKTLRLTCHGHFPAGALCPPTMPTSSVLGPGSKEADEEPSGTQAALPGAQHGAHTSPEPSSRGGHHPRSAMA